MKKYSRKENFQFYGCVSLAVIVGVGIVWGQGKLEDMLEHSQHNASWEARIQDSERRQSLARAAEAQRAVQQAVDRLVFVRHPETGLCFAYETPVFETLDDHKLVNVPCANIEHLLAAPPAPR